jgi:predicted RNase H-like HicB family nuclease
MDIHQYPAIVEIGEGDDIGIFFPDIPGCVSMGSTFKETIISAVQVLDFHVKGYLEDGIPVPEPSTLSEIPLDSEVREVARILVPVEVPG